ncbi:MAG TPA: cobalamin-dependent protein [Syntrophomonadaceae bacterium]|nr:cobalamin-dependent protein [Syntrophomonadaceae bacterium]
MAAFPEDITGAPAVDGLVRKTVYTGRMVNISMKKMKILLAKAGLDPHDKGVKLLAHTLRDVGGLDVVYTGLYRTVEEIVEEAVKHNVDMVGLSVHTGLHMTLFPTLRGQLDGAGLGHVPIIGGGVMPDQDMKALKTCGIVAEMFRYTQTIQEVINWLWAAQAAAACQEAAD